MVDNNDTDDPGADFESAAEHYESAATMWQIVTVTIIAGTLLWAYRRDKRRGKLGKLW